MAAPVHSLPRVVEASDERIFFERPETLYVDEDHSVKPPRYDTIKDLMQSLRENGPLVAVGPMGPRAYREPPFALKGKVGEETIYGWKPQAPRALAQPSDPVMLLGASEGDNRAHVYFTKARDVTRNRDSSIRAYKPSLTDPNVYVVSYPNFLQRDLVDLHPLCPYGEWLYSTVPLDSILDKGEWENQCKTVGQKIFDKYKENAQGNSTAGRDAVVRICNAAKWIANDGSIRKALLEAAWDGIGDHEWRWRH